MAPPNLALTKVSSSQESTSLHNVRSPKMPPTSPIRFNYQPQPITIPWRPPPNVVMETFMSLIQTVACFEELINLGTIQILYPHIESMWNYHQLTNEIFHQLYYKPSLRGEYHHKQDYSYYYRHHPIIKNLMEAHTKSFQHHLIIFYIGGETQVLSMMKVSGPYQRPFVKLYAELDSFDRATQLVLDRVPRGHIRVLCFVSD